MDCIAKLIFSWTLFTFTYFHLFWKSAKKRFGKKPAEKSILDVRLSKFTYILFWTMIFGQGFVRNFPKKTLTRDFYNYFGPMSCNARENIIVIFNFRSCSFQNSNDHHHRSITSLSVSATVQLPEPGCFRTLVVLWTLTGLSNLVDRGMIDKKKWVWPYLFLLISCTFTSIPSRQNQTHSPWFSSFTMSDRHSYAHTPTEEEDTYDVDLQDEDDFWLDDNDQPQSQKAPGTPEQLQHPSRQTNRPSGLNVHIKNGVKGPKTFALPADRASFQTMIGDGTALDDEGYPLLPNGITTFVVCKDQRKPANWGSFGFTYTTSGGGTQNGTATWRTVRYSCLGVIVCDSLACDYRGSPFTSRARQAGWEARWENLFCIHIPSSFQQLTATFYFT